jgi:AraC-like DNA-binding protein
MFSPMDKPGVVVLWVHSGASRLRLGECSLSLRKGAFFWLFNRRQSRVFTQQDRPLVAETIRFSGPGVEAWLEELDVARRPEFELKRPEIIHKAHDRLVRLVQQRPPHWEWESHDVLHAMLREFLMARQLLSRRHLPREILHVLNAIEADPFRDWKMAELAACAGLSESTFRAHFREAMHEAPHQYVQRCRLDLARELLSDPNLRIKEIAGRLHFSNEDYFTRFFRQQAGMTPTEFRKHLAGSKRRM